MMWLRVVAINDYADHADGEGEEGQMYGWVLHRVLKRQSHTWRHVLKQRMRMSGKNYLDD